MVNIKAPTAVFGDTVAAIFPENSPSSPAFTTGKPASSLSLPEGTRFGKKLTRIEYYLFRSGIFICGALAIVFVLCQMVLNFCIEMSTLWRHLMSALKV